MKKICDSNLLTFLIILLATFLYQLILSSSLSPLSILEGTDSCVFKQMGLTLIKGNVLYQDLFDHKGPFLYYINAMAQWLVPGRWGLFLFYVLNIAIVTFLWYKTALLYLNKKQAIFPVTIALFSYLLVNYDGNLTEDWCLLPISYGFYLFAKYYKTRMTPTLSEYFLLGVCMGLITMMRVNNMIAICCVILVYTIIFLKNRNYKEVIKMIVLLLLGFVLVISSILLILYLLYGTTGLSEMFYGAFTFNFEYMQSSQAVSPNRYRGILMYGVITTVLILLIVYYRKLNDKMSALLVLCYIATFAVIGTKGWSNYYIIFAPITMMTVTVLFKYIKRWQKLLIFMMFFAFIPYKTYNAIKTGIINTPARTFYGQTDEFINSLSNDEKNNIWNYNTTFRGLAALQRIGIVQVNRVILKFQMIISEKLRVSEMQRFEKKQPMWVMVESKLDPNNNYDFEGAKILEHYTCYKTIEEGPYSICFYKRVSAW